MVLETEEEKLQINGRAVFVTCVLVRVHLIAMKLGVVALLAVTAQGFTIPFSSVRIQTSRLFLTGAQEEEEERKQKFLEGLAECLDSHANLKSDLEKAKAAKIFTERDEFHQ